MGERKRPKRRPPMSLLCSVSRKSRSSRKLSTSTRIVTDSSPRKIWPVCSPQWEKIHQQPTWDMIKEATGDINFTTFLTLFGEKLHGTDPEDVILNAFKCFDPEGTKVIPGEELKRLLTAMGERFTKEEVEEMFNEQECDDAGNFDYVEFTRLIKHGPREEE